MTTTNSSKSNRTGARHDTAKRSPGRPSGQPDQAVRQRLLDVAIELVAREGADKVSIRRIAQHAEVTPAMVHYYFGNRDGLLNAMLEEAMKPVFQALEQWHQQPAAPPLAAATPSPNAPLAAMIAAATATVARNPWLPNIIVREVLGREGPFRERFIERIAGRGRGLIVSNIENAQRNGQLRADADPLLCALSLISLVMFPFLALPVSSRLYGVSLEPDFLQRLIDHNQQLLLRGLNP